MFINSLFACGAVFEIIQQALAAHQNIGGFDDLQMPFGQVLQ